MMSIDDSKQIKLQLYGYQPMENFTQYLLQWNHYQQYIDSYLTKNPMSYFKTYFYHRTDDTLKYLEEVKKCFYKEPLHNVVTESKP